uniref:Uncharacterized protein n=1 Tax=Quercus lobata TaxID=97700 RepID=A0A7N2LTT0_QUELO
MEEMRRKKEEKKREEMERKEEKKRKKEKRQDGSGGGKKKKERKREAPVEEERKKQGYFVPASVLTPNTLVPWKAALTAITAIQYSAPDRAILSSFFNHPQPLRKTQKSKVSSHLDSNTADSTSLITGKNGLGEGIVVTLWGKPWVNAELPMSRATGDVYQKRLSSTSTMKLLKLINMMST